MTYLGAWSTYFIRTNTSSPYSGYGGDACAQFKAYYEYQASSSRYKVNIECYLRRKPQQEEESGKIVYELYSTSGNIRSTVNGNNGTQTNFNKGNGYAGSQSLTTELITTQTFYVYPNSSTGQASVNFSGRFYGSMYGGDVSATRTCSHTWSLPTVAVGSAITNNTSSSSKINFGSNVTFTITPPSGSSFTHTLTYSVGGTTYTIASATSNTSISYAFPTSLINSYPSNRYPSITVTCLSSNGTTSSTEVFLQVPDTDTYRPTVSISLQDVMSNKPSALDGMWIKNKSLLKGTITATAKNGASIDESKYVSSISGFNQSYYTSPFTTASALTIAGSRTVTYSATDTRGLTKTSTQNITVVDYTTPSISSAKVERCNPSGTLDETGSYGKVTVSYKVAPLNNGSVNKNTKTLTVKKGNDTAQTISTTSNVYEETVSAWFDFSLTETSTDRFTITLIDIFNSPVTYTFDIGTVFKTVSKRAGGKGIAFGKIATQDGFDCNMDATFRGKVNNYTLADACARGVKTRSSVGDLGWGTNNTYVADLGMLAYWNGRYDGSSSNLQYCDRGRFGDIVTHSASE
ncbi:MAG: hypothetical protein J6W64_01290, partial [Bacilli bacterium]|nr:hypothetical protein [Bacilli bacterium]